MCSAPSWRAEAVRQAQAVRLAPAALGEAAVRWRVVLGRVVLALCVLLATYALYAAGELWWLRALKAPVWVGE